MSAAILTGLKHRQTLRVTDALTVPAVSSAFASFADMPPVFATAYLVGFVEWACIDALKPYLTVQKITVGTHVNLSHSAATPVGVEVTAEVELIAVDRNRLTFSVQCGDEVDVICEGQHERFVTDAAAFLQKVAAKGEGRNG